MGEDKKKTVDLGLLEEDDEFEEFPAEEWDKKDDDSTDVNVWEDNWDDDTIEDDFSVQLSKFGRKRSLGRRSPPLRSPEPAPKKMCLSSAIEAPAPKHIRTSSNGHAANGAGNGAGGDTTPPRSRPTLRQTRPPEPQPDLIKQLRKIEPKGVNYRVKESRWKPEELREQYKISERHPNLLNFCFMRQTCQSATHP